MKENFSFLYEKGSLPLHRDWGIGVLGPLMAGFHRMTPRPLGKQKSLGSKGKRFI
jgi:hypothetical protein